jgi:hypothetical protein
MECWFMNHHYKLTGRHGHVNIYVSRGAEMRSRTTVQNRARAEMEEDTRLL